MILPLAQFQVALMMLTRLPAGRVSGEFPKIAASAWAFPFVGVIVGLLAAGGFQLATALGLPPSLAGLIAVAVSVLVTGALHEDGLADMADGFGGGQERDRKLEIMRDSRIGTYGVVALILVLAMRVAAIASVAQAGWALIAIAAFSRAMMPQLMWCLPPARQDGLGRSAGTVAAKTALVALAIGVALLVPLGAAGVVAGVGMLAVAAGVGWLARRQIGGQTGDVLGATQQLSEVSGWLILAAIA